MAGHILIVDDDPHIREVIGFAAEKSGFTTTFVEDGLAAVSAVRVDKPDLVVLDIGLPEMDGLEVCREIRKTSDLPILFLTARDDEIDRIVGLEIGGDDYVTKPFSPRELVARIKAILKRTQPVAIRSDRRFCRGDLEIDLNRHACVLAGETIALTASEFSLLETLMERPENVISRQRLIDAVYGANIHVSDRTIDSHIRNIRNKLTQAGCHDSIVTVHGVGLRMGACRSV
ncbi:response regulator transcription factor [Rhodobacteraceae bacterium B1Z28]|uniref:Response regulator transcription factor n=1 Tax=Ruegeria haliotis TaxID=2747601 RepID=A0ABX2PQ13_9RHOB|nr:response regulator transcription factor [Ruegeria haliotis]NVO55771.1 response regulator transcription factor [Ruegeria haliotis]